MLAFVSLPELKTYLGNFVSNDEAEPEFNDIELQKKLNAQAKKIQRTWNALYPKESLPSPAGTVTIATWLDLLLELLNLDYVVSEILRIQSIRKFGLSKRQAEIYEQFANWRFDLFESGSLSPAILSYLSGRVFDTASFLEASDRRLSNQTPNLTLTEDTNPSLSQAQRFALRESAFIRAIAATPGFNTTIAHLSEDQLDIYIETLAALTAPQIARIVLSYDENPIIQVNEFTSKSILDGNSSSIYSAKALIDTLLNGEEYLPIFLIES